MRPPARLCRTKAIAGLTAGALLVFAALGAVGPAVGATLVINVQTADGHALAGAVITVRPLDGAPRKPAAVHAVMDQVDRAFEPDLLVVPVGSTVEFPNSDSVSHQVYSFSPAKRFQLPLYKGQIHPPITFDRAGLVVLGCNIHDSMVGYIYVTDAAYFGTTESGGGLQFKDIPV